MPQRMFSRIIRRLKSRLGGASAQEHEQLPGGISVIEDCSYSAEQVILRLKIFKSNTKKKSGISIAGGGNCDPNNLPDAVV